MRVRGMPDRPTLIAVACAGILVLGGASFGLAYEFSSGGGVGPPDPVQDDISAVAARPAPTWAYAPPVPTVTVSLPASPLVSVTKTVAPKVKAAPAPVKRALKPLPKPKPVRKAKPAPVKKPAPAPAPVAKKKPAAPKPANAAPSHRSLVSRATGVCLDSNDVGDVYGLTCNDGTYQEWAADRVGGSASRTYMLRNQQTGRCLTFDTVHGIYTDLCSGSDPSQQWTWKGTNASSEWVQRTNGECLDGNDVGHVYTHDCNNGAYQKYRLV